MELIEHLREHGWARVAQAFSHEAAAAMRDAVWRALAENGIQRDKPSTWIVERPARLQRLKDDPVFRAVGSPSVLATIDSILAGRAYAIPKNWGALFIAFPGKDEWRVPASGWHIDAKYTSALAPPGGVKTLALFGDVAPSAGGTQIVSGSHRLVHRWFKESPPPAGITNSGVVTVTVFTRMRGETYSITSMTPGMRVIWGLNIVCFALASMLYGAAVTGMGNSATGLTSMLFVIFTAFCSLVFELAVEREEEAVQARLKAAH